MLTQQAVAAIKKARVGGPCSDLEGLAVLAFNPARRFATACPGGSAGGVAVFGHANAGGLGLAGAEDVILGQTELLDEFADLGDDSAFFRLQGGGDLCLKLGLLLEEGFVSCCHVFLMDSVLHNDAFYGDRAHVACGTSLVFAPSLCSAYPHALCADRG